MGDSTFTPRTVYNSNALRHLNIAIAHLSLAATEFEIAQQKEQAVEADRILDNAAKLQKQVSK